MVKRLRPVISLVLLLLSIGLVSYYLDKHHSLVKQLSHTPLYISALVFGLYLIMFLALMFIFKATMGICRVNLGKAENLKLNAHTLLINFFVPGQSGPAYRGIYLKKRHKLNISSYLVVTLLYYAFYALVSVTLLFVTNRPWWQTIIALLLVAIISKLVIDRYLHKIKVKLNSLSITPRTILLLFIATITQAVVQIAIYGVELRSVNHHINFSQILTYTGAANLALFVSLTPGAIGIREAFLIFTEKLNHISSANIILANLIDRSVYLIFLLLIFVLIIIMQFRIKHINKLVAVKATRSGLS